MEDMLMPIWVDRGKRVLTRVFLGAFEGMWLGALVAALTGALAGSAAGWYNEATTAGQPNEGLFVDVAEHSMQGMAFSCGYLSSVFGAIGGIVCGAVAGVTLRTWMGLLLGSLILLLLAIWGSIHSLVLADPQAGWVCLFAMSGGATVAAVVCAKETVLMTRYRLIKAAAARYGAIGEKEFHRPRPGNGP
jgi:hypothetical protein